MDDMLAQSVDHSAPLHVPQHHQQLSQGHTLHPFPQGSTSSSSSSSCTSPAVSGRDLSTLQQQQPQTPTSQQLQAVMQQQSSHSSSPAMSSSMVGSSPALTQEWMQVASAPSPASSSQAEFGAVGLVGFDMFGFQSSSDMFAIDHTEFASTDFFPSSMNIAVSTPTASTPISLSEAVSASVNIPVSTMPSTPSALTPSPFEGAGPFLNFQQQQQQPHQQQVSQQQQQQQINGVQGGLAHPNGQSNGHDSAMTPTNALGSDTTMSPVGFALKTQGLDGFDPFNLQQQQQQQQQSSLSQSQAHSLPEPSSFASMTIPQNDNPLSGSVVLSGQGTGGTDGSVTSFQNMFFNAAPASTTGPTSITAKRTVRHRHSVSVTSLSSEGSVTIKQEPIQTKHPLHVRSQPQLMQSHQQHLHQMALQQQQQQQRGIHPLSTSALSNSITSTASGNTVGLGMSTSRPLNKRPSDLHVDISGRSSSFRLNGDVRAGDFRFNTDANGHQDTDPLHTPMSPGANNPASAPLTPAFFSPAFGEALGSPGAILYQNSPFVLNAGDRNRTSMQTDSSIGSFMDIQASNASSPSSMSSLNDVGQRMFRNSVDSIQMPLETVTPMDIAFGELSTDMNFMDKIKSSQNSAFRESFCHSPDHIDPQNVEVKPSIFSREIKAEPGLDTIGPLEIKQEDTFVFKNRKIDDAGSMTTMSSSESLSGIAKTARKRRSNEGCSTATTSAGSTPSYSPSPPCNDHRRSMSVSSSDEKESISSSRMTSSMAIHPVRLTRDTQPPSLDAMRNIIRRYLDAKTPSAGSEKSVLILTSKVAQKSYGTEKRFLCPPPTTLLLGSNWWSVPPGADGKDAVPQAPKMVISICGEAGSQHGVIDWTQPSEDEPVTPVVTGKCVSKQLYINDADEKRKKVEVLVKLMMAGDMELGTFASKPIKVISKPSKKRQSIKNMELCIHHGTTISLFNRIRSQTVSTKYLGVSTTSNASSHAPWNFGANNLRDWPGVDPNNDSNSNPVNADGGTCFVARTGSWDPFVVWIVSPGQTRTETLEEHALRHPGFPPPPAIALNSPPPNGPQIPIHYNQPIVLQCLSTGLVSPVMVIRKVDKGSMVLGGGSSGSPSAEYDQEAIGDPVSQLHKVAFQITGQAAPPTFPHTKLQQGTYLACLGDVVGMQRANEGKKYLPDSQGASSPPPSSGSSSTSHANTMEIVPEFSESPIPNNLFSAWGSSADDKAQPISGQRTIVTTADGVKVERKRRVSSSVVIKPSGQIPRSIGKNRRRVNSMSVTPAEAQRIRVSALAAHQQQSQTPVNTYVALQPTIKESREKAKDAAKAHTLQQRRNSTIWTEDVTDAAVWTIVGTDCAQYNFCNPGGLDAMTLPQSPLTPMPKVTEVSANTKGINGAGILKSRSGTPDASSKAGIRIVSTGNHHVLSVGTQHNNMPRTITLKGHGFQRDLSVWFGTSPAMTEFHSEEVLVAHVPEDVLLRSYDLASGDDHERRKRVKEMNGRQDPIPIPILLVRQDGVIFRSGHSVSMA
ncbi:hypothetical protein BGW41_002253 [Actinomortierella wolfii]|nr:hypothetical protein BGW41_002253 [Actinomortierella wolfii]